MIYFILVFLIGIIVGLAIMSIFASSRYRNYQEIINRLYKKLNNKNNKRR